jgi:hypothetical protein
MASNLLEEVQTELARRKAEWQQIADDTGLSYELVSRLGLGSYKSSPTFKSLQLIADRLRRKNGNGAKRRATA